MRQLHRDVDARRIGVHVIGPDGVTPFDMRGGHQVLLVTLATEQAVVPLTQDPKSGRVDANFGGTLADNADRSSATATTVTATVHAGIETAVENLGLLR